MVASLLNQVCSYLLREEMSRLKVIWVLARTSIQNWTKDNAAQLAASIAFYTILSIPPLLILSLTIAGFIYDTDTARNHLISQIGGLVGLPTAGFVRSVLDNPIKVSTVSLASVFSLVVLLGGTSGVFYQIQYALNKIWNVPKKQDLSVWKTVKNRFVSFLLFLGISLLFLITIILSIVFSVLIGKNKVLFQNVFLLNMTNFFVLFITVALLVAIIYKAIPDKDTSWREIWLGAVVTSLLFVLGKFGIGYYLSAINLGSIYGAAGSFIVLMIWIYISTLIFLLGAEFTHLYARKFGPRQTPVLKTKFGIEKVPDRNETGTED